MGIMTKAVIFWLVLLAAAFLALSGGWLFKQARNSVKHLLGKAMRIIKPLPKKKKQQRKPKAPRKRRKK